jgi:F-type H+-transporting ATPase subunit epsilon
VGSIGILAHHQPLLAMLDPTELRLYRSDSDIVRFAQGEGYLQVAHNRALVLVQEAHEPGQLSSGELQERLDRAQRALSEAEAGSEAYEAAQRDKRRWEAFLRVAGSADA